MATRHNIYLKPVRQTFRTYLESCDPDDFGPLARDFIADSLDLHSFPEDFKLWQDLRRYLHMRNACDGAIEGAAEVWNAYRKNRR